MAARTARPRTSRRIGLALAGGGPLGAFYELGALQALTECIEGFDPCNLFAYAGVSSGSMLAAGLANGLKPVDIGRITPLGHESRQQCEGGARRSAGALACHFRSRTMPSARRLRVRCDSRSALRPAALTSK